MGRGAERRVPRSGNHAGRILSGMPTAFRFGFAEHAFGVPHPSPRYARRHLPLQGRRRFGANPRVGVGAQEGFTLRVMNRRGGVQAGYGRMR